MKPENNSTETEVWLCQGRHAEIRDRSIARAHYCADNFQSKVQCFVVCDYGHKYVTGTKYT
ncbi:hypothetical protein NPIL_94411, partial [Nephila pilipes]